MTTLSKRRCYYYADGERFCDTVWESWARWVFLAIVIAGGFLVFFLFSCISARRRRRRGMQPFMGTGWAANMGPWGKPGNQQYPPPPQYQYPPPPQYTPSGGYYNQNSRDPGETSQQQTGIELQQPPNAYHGESSYGPPPMGPSPQKKT